MTETRTTQPITEAENTANGTPEPMGETTAASGDSPNAGAGLGTNATPGTAGVAQRTDSPAAPAGGAASAVGAAPAATAAPAAPPASIGGTEAPLFAETDAKDLQTRWQAIQVGFVDEPKGAVQQADQLVDEVMRRLAESFTRERQELERAWSGGDEASTEDLRQAIRRYRSFFNRLLAL